MKFFSAKNIVAVLAAVTCSSASAEGLDPEGKIACQLSYTFTSKIKAERDADRNKQFHKLSALREEFLSEENHTMVELIDVLRELVRELVR